MSSNTLITAKGPGGMFPNIEVEQALNGHSDEYVAGKLGISERAYRARKKSGKFLATEAVALLAMYRGPFEYLFGLGGEGGDRRDIV